MALIFFRQSEIDEMDPSNVPETFKNYFGTLDQPARAAILERRPELAAALGAVPEKIEIQQETSEKDSVEQRGNEDTKKRAVAENDRIGIHSNYYKNTPVLNALKNNMRYLEVLTIRDDIEKCPAHRTKFIKKQINFDTVRGGTFAMYVYVCRKCNRAFIKESRAENVHKKLTERNVRHKIYDLKVSTEYLASQMEEREISGNEYIFIPQNWVEEDPKCQIHNVRLDQIPCKRRYKDRCVNFTGYYCPKCDKILIRPAQKSYLLDQCYEIGVPEIEFAPLVEKTDKKKVNFRRIKKPDYRVEDGKRHVFDLDMGDGKSVYCLEEKDIVVVADSIYCGRNGHGTEEVPAIIKVDERRDGKKSYMFLLGYCNQCRKYYMDVDDFKAFYKAGRPCVTLLYDVDGGSFNITSGAEFNREEKHLDGLEKKINGEIDDIKKSPDYINKYATSGYDDGGLAYAKDRSYRKYEARLVELDGYSQVPYLYRVDIANGSKTEKYYVGVKEVMVDGEVQVISANSDFGHELVNYQNVKVERDGKEYAIKLTRQFDIARATLFGYNNLRTDEDLVFKKGITDPFLVRVLNMRKRQHNLTDIFFTIQEEQNGIVNLPFGRNLIVQGCAGSGKTMVMLHRLSSLEYREKDFDFSKHALILTPNEQFSLYISDLSEGLQIGSIMRDSVEEYYIHLLGKYDNALKPGRKLSQEQYAPKAYVDYIYSDSFKTDFSAAYEETMADRKVKADLLGDLAEEMGLTRRVIDFSQDADAAVQMKYALDAVVGADDVREMAVAKAEELLEKLEKQEADLQGKLPAAVKAAEVIVQETLKEVYSKIAEYLKDKENAILQMEQEIDRLVHEKEKIQNAIIVIGKQDKLKKIEKKMKATEQKKERAKKSYEEASEVLSEQLEGKTDDEIIEWMEKSIKYIPLRDEIDNCRNVKEKAMQFEKDCEKLGIDIADAKEDLDIKKSEVYSEEIKKPLQYLRSCIEGYGVADTFKAVFYQSVSRYVEENNIKVPQGMNYRYTLYAKLLFAMRYFGEAHGTEKFICVDEGQDLALNEYRLIYELNGKDVVMNVFGDTNQLIKPGRGISDWSELREFLHAESRELNENYRNTNQITRFCNDSFDMNVLETGVDGMEVREIARKELEYELSSMELGTNRVAVIIPRSVRKTSYIDFNLVTSDVSAVIGDEIGEGRIFVAYVDEVKGIEFERVFTVTKGLTKNERYIAYTRALSELILVVDDVSDDGGKGQRRADEF